MFPSNWKLRSEWLAMAAKTENRDLAMGLKSALSIQDMASLEDQLRSIGLDRACSQDFIDYCRALHHDELVLLLCTLGTENGVNPGHCGLLLALYQSRRCSSLPAIIDSLPARHVLRMVALSCGQEYSSAQHEKLLSGWSGAAGSAEQFRLAVEFLIDQHRVDRAGELLACVWSVGQLDEVKMLTLRAVAARFRLRAPGTDECIALLPVLQLILRRLSDLQAAASIQDDVAMLTAQVAAGAGDYTSALRAAAQVRTPLQRVKACFFRVEILSRNQNIGGAIAAMDEVLTLVLRLGAAEARKVLHAPGGNQMLDHPFDETSAATALADLCATLASSGRRPFLVSGTLLGYARQGSFLKHDKDIDIGLLHDGDTQSLRKLIQAGGQFNVFVDQVPEAPTYNMVAVHEPTGMAVDIFLYRRTASGMVTGVRNGMGHLQTFVFTPFDLRKVTFAGVDVWIPADFDLNLTENFGAWRTPDAGYLPHVESPSIEQPLGETHLLVARLEMLYALLQGNRRKVGRLFDFFSRNAGVEHALSARVLAIVRPYADSLAPQSPVSQRDLKAQSDRIPLNSRRPALETR